MKKIFRRNKVQRKVMLDVTQIQTLSDWGLCNEKIAYVMGVPISVINQFMNKHNIIESL